MREKERWRKRRVMRNCNERERERFPKNRPMERKGGRGMASSITMIVFTKIGERKKYLIAVIFTGKYIAIHK